jgi:7-cyano-7-deazaguanine synthase in queuosine biosynthesis
MSTKVIYHLADFENITANGFDYSLPDETVQIIQHLTQQVGSPSYDKTPVFKKNELIATASTNNNNGNNNNGNKNKKNRNRNMEITSDEQWETMQTFQTTQLETKVGIEKELDTIRAYINKITDKNYIDIRNKIVATIDTLIDTTTNIDLTFIGKNLFAIASSNRFYSKNYAELYADLSNKYDFMKTYYEDNLQEFVQSFQNIEYVDADQNYDKFCELNKINEKRKSMAMFYMNLMNNGIVSKKQMVGIIRDLVSTVFEYISLDNYKTQVEEIAENISIMYKPELFNGSVECEPIQGHSVNEIIRLISNSKIKDYKSLTNKTIFKFMDLIDM